MQHRGNNEVLLALRLQQQRKMEEGREDNNLKNDGFSTQVGDPSFIPTWVQDSFPALTAMGYSSSRDPVSFSNLWEHQAHTQCT